MNKKNIAVIMVVAGLAAWLASATLAQRKQGRLADAFPAKLLVSPKVCSTPTWPAEARRYEIEGISLLTFRIGVDGSVQDAAVAKSSGWKVLDDAAVASLVKCKFKPDLDEAKDQDTFPIQFVWTMTGTPPMRPSVVQGSCEKSQRFAGFKTFDRAATGPDGMLVRLIVDASGAPAGVKVEADGADPALAAQVASWVQTCKFAVDPALKGEQTDTTFGRVTYLSR